MDGNPPWNPSTHPHGPHGPHVGEIHAAIAMQREAEWRAQDEGDRRKRFLLLLCQS
jgi:hypothetical protein